MDECRPKLLNSDNFDQKMQFHGSLEEFMKKNNKIQRSTSNLD